MLLDTPVHSDTLHTITCTPFTPVKCLLDTHTHAHTHSSAGILPMEAKRELTANQNSLEQDLAALRAAYLDAKAK